MYRKSQSKRFAKKQFHRGANKSHRKNSAYSPRGGIRL